MGWSRYRDANPLPTRPLADDITTAQSGPVTPTSISFICLFFTAWFNLYGVLFHALCMSHAQVMLNTATRLKHVLLTTKNSAPPRRERDVAPW